MLRRPIPRISRVNSSDDAIRSLRERAEAAEGEVRLLRAAFEGSTLGILVVGEDGAVLSSNPVADRVLTGGADDAALRGRLRSLIRRVNRTGEAEDLEIDLYSPVRRVVGLRASRIAVTGPEPGGALVYIDDRTERARLDATRRDFVANAAHELRTPLGALTVLAETLVGTDDAEARARLAARLSGEAHRMAMVVDDIVQLAAVESVDVPHVPVAVGEIVQGAVESAGTMAEEAGVELVVAAVPPRVVVLGDRAQLVSALANLLNNAVKFTAIRGSADPVRIETRLSDGNVAIGVEDRGIGIDERHLDRIFERFYRVDRARGRASGGTGLGLSIVRNIVTAHGGDIHVESVYGRGSTFTMMLPLEDG